MAFSSQASKRPFQKNVADSPRKSPRLDSGRNEGTSTNATSATSSLAQNVIDLVLTTNNLQQLRQRIDEDTERERLARKYGIEPANSTITKDIKERERLEAYIDSLKNLLQQNSSNESNLKRDAVGERPSALAATITNPKRERSTSDIDALRTTSEKIVSWQADQEKKMHDLDQEVTHLKGIVTTKNVEISSLLKSLREECAKTRESLQTQSGQVEQFQEQIVLLSTEITNLKSERARVETHIKDITLNAQSTLSLVTNIKDSTAEAIEQLKVEQTRLKEEQAQFEAERARLKSEQAQSNEGQAELKADLALFRAERLQTDTDRADLNASQVRLGAELSGITATMKNFSRSLTRLENRSEQYEDRFAVFSRAQNEFRQILDTQVLASQHHYMRTNLDLTQASRSDSISTTLPPQPQQQLSNLPSAHTSQQHQHQQQQQQHRVGYDLPRPASQMQTASQQQQMRLRQQGRQQAIYSQPNRMQQSVTMPSLGTPGQHFHPDDTWSSNTQAQPAQSNAHVGIDPRLVQALRNLVANEVGPDFVGIREAVQVVMLKIDSYEASQRELKTEVRNNKESIEARMAQQTTVSNLAITTATDASSRANRASDAVHDLEKMFAATSPGGMPFGTSRERGMSHSFSSPVPSTEDIKRLKAEFVEFETLTTRIDAQVKVHEETIKAIQPTLLEHAQKMDDHAQLFAANNDVTSRLHESVAKLEGALKHNIGPSIEAHDRELDKLKRGQLLEAAVVRNSIKRVERHVQLEPTDFREEIKLAEERVRVAEEEQQRVAATGRNEGAWD